MNLKRCLALLLAVLMIAGTFVSCSKNKNEEPVKTKRTNVYSGIDFQLPEEVNYLQSFTASGKTLYGTYYQNYIVVYNEAGEEVERTSGYDDSKYYDKNYNSLLPEGWYLNYEGQQRVVAIDADSGELKYIDLETPEYTYMYNYVFGKDGTIASYYQDWTYNDDYSESHSVITFYVFDQNGKLKTTASGNDMLKAASLDPDNIYIDTFYPMDDGYAVRCDYTIVFTDSNFNYKSKFEMNDGWINGFYSANGSYIIQYYDNITNKNMVKQIINGNAVDVNSDVLKEIFNSYPTVLGARDNKLYYSEYSTGVWAYDFGTDTTEIVMDYINSDVDYSNLGNLALLDDGRIVITSTDWSGDTTSTSISVYTKVPDEELKEEIILKLGCTYVNYYLTKAIISFNKQNTGVRVSIVSYDKYNNEENDWTGAATQFNNDIVTGNVPDLVLLDSSLPVQSYFKKNIFLDLTSYIDGENGIDRSKLMENILDASKVSGKQYSIIYAYYVTTLFAKSEFVGKEPGWTFAEMLDAIKKMPDGMEPFLEYSRDSIINSFFTNSMDSFINYETGETKFESQEFIDFIKFLSTCRTEDFWSELYGDNYEYDDDMYREYEEKYRLRFVKNYSLFNMQSFSDFLGYLNAISNFGTEDITAIGYPTESGSGACISPEIEIAISSKTTAKNECWSVIKYFINNEELANSIYAFTINKELMKKKCANAKDDYWSTEEVEGGGVFAAESAVEEVVAEVDVDIAVEEPEYDDYYEEYDPYQWYRESGYSEEYIEFIKNQNHKYEQKYADMVFDIITNTTKVQRGDSALLDIINEELSGYFGGSKTAEETAKVISSRVRIYISENS